MQQRFLLDLPFKTKILALTVTNMLMRHMIKLHVGLTCRNIHSRDEEKYLKIIVRYRVQIQAIYIVLGYFFRAWQLCN